MKALFNKIRHNYGKIILFAVIAIFYLIHGCPIRFFTGIACPGCGMTRALFALSRLDFPLAFEMHPLVFLLPVAVIVYFSRKLIPKKVLKPIYTSALILLITVYIIRLNGNSNVVYADFESGIIYKLISML